MPQKQIPATNDVAARWKMLERVFAGRQYDGARSSSGTGLHVTEPAPGLVEVAGTTRPGLVVTATHATNHSRGGESKRADRGTGGLALLLAELTGCRALVTAGSPHAEPGDANFDAQHPLKDRLSQLPVDTVIDLHGMRTREGLDVDFGLGEGAVPENFLATLEGEKGFTRNALFAAMRPTTVTAFAQQRGIAAVQVEIGAHLRPPDADPAAMTWLVDTLARAIVHECATPPESDGSRHDRAVAPVVPQSVPGAVTHHLNTVTARIPSGVPMAVLHPSLLPDVGGPIPVTVRTNGRTAVAWAWPADAPGVPARLREIAPTEVGVTRLTNAALTGDSGLASGPDQVEVVLPPLHRRRIVAGLGDDMPGPHEVQVSTQEFARPAAYLLTRDGVVAWVTAVPRDHVLPGTVRVDHQYRMLTAVRSATARGDGGEVPQYLALAAAPRAMFARGADSTRRRRVLIAVDQRLERLWRFLLRAPEFSARVVQAHAGDDGESVVSLSRGAFDRIGIEPGMQVVVRWGGREAVARAVEEHEPEATEAAKAEQRVDTLWPDTPDGMPAQDIVRTSARLRAQLGAPVSTVVTVRRRVGTFLTANLYKFALPVSGLALAVYQIDNPRWPAIGLAAAAMTVFAFTRLRMPKPPRHPRVDTGWVDTMATPPETAHQPERH